jgi:hypothetical protein
MYRTMPRRSDGVGIPPMPVRIPAPIAAAGGGPGAEGAREADDHTHANVPDR